VRVYQTCVDRSLGALLTRARRACYKPVDLLEVRLTLGVIHARLATGQELGQLFPDCELGAMPPFGNLYGVPVYLDSSLAPEDLIAFNGGTHRDVVHMRTSLYRYLVNPTVISLAREAVLRHGW
jgi:Ala-tRNA(Pro) deacylase